jgi:spore coat protein CotH
MQFRILTFICIFGIISGCNDKIETDIPPGSEGTENPSEPGLPPEDPTPSWPEGETGKSYVWDKEHIPHITVYVKKNNWKTILDGYDNYTSKSAYVGCNVVFDKNGVRDSISNVALRLRDNNDAMRPTDSLNEMYINNQSQWNLSNYELNFTRFVNKESNSLRKVNGLFLKSCYNDPTLSRERYCYDLYERLGIWTIARNTYCRLSFHVEGDTNPAYLGVYQMIEPVDNSYLEDRKGHFGSTKGNLWKCHAGASLSTTVNLKTGVETNDGATPVYMLITPNSTIDVATQQLKSFINNLTTIDNSRFKEWIESICDVRLLLYTYAVNVTVGMWDDYWNNANNYYLYFDSTSADSYKVYMIPHDHEMSLGNSSSAHMSEPALQDPFNWGKSKAPLIKRILSVDEYRLMYGDIILELLQQGNYLFYYYEAIDMIKDLMHEVEPYTENITGINMTPIDKPGPKSSNKTYRLTQDGRDCFFYQRLMALNEFITTQQN